MNAYLEKANLGNVVTVIRETRIRLLTTHSLGGSFQLQFKMFIRDCWRTSILL